MVARFETTAAGAGRAAGATEAAVRKRGGARGLLLYFLAGTYFGVVLTKGEAVSWFRIQEMFRFGSFHMYGLLFSAVAVAAVSLRVLKRLGARSLEGEPIVVPAKVWGKGYRYWIGGTIFGVGWGLTGACPGPIFALAGAGVAAAPVVLAGALLGTWVYAHVRPRLPH